MRCWLIGTLLLAQLAHAETQRSVDYDAAKVFPAAVRFLRVTEGAKVTEKDADAGYVLFTLRDEGKSYEGAFEIIRDDNEAGVRTRLVLRIEDRPDYMEAVLLDRFERKLRSDLGSPPPRKRPPPKPPSDAIPPGEEDANPKAAPDEPALRPEKNGTPSLPNP